MIKAGKRPPFVSLVTKMGMINRVRFIQLCPAFLKYVMVCSITVFLSIRVVTSCEFPEALRMKAIDPPWISHVRAGPATETSDGGAVGVLPHDSEYFIRQSVMEIHYPRSPERAHVRWRCSMSYGGKLLLKRQDHLINNYYRCVKVYFRSPSLVQVAWSREATEFDLALCEDKELILDPWLLLRSESLHMDQSQCPISGGFNMKLADSQLGDSACNLMRRPMRLEAECVGGEGVNFDFVTPNCLPDLRMYVHQRTLCVTNWKDQQNLYIVLRRNEDINVWCLVIPTTNNVRFNKTAFLYNDLACWNHPPDRGTPSSKHPDLPSNEKPLKYFTLRLSTRLYSSLCEDEYSACSSVTCNAYVKHECQRSCQVCDSDESFSSCEYPRRLQGLWQLRDINGVTQLQITGSNFSLDRVGNFQCVTYPDGPKKRSRVYTTVTLSNNGCRPRYSCLKIKRLGPAVISYSLSHSFIWPELQEQYGSKICADDRFFPDPSPLDDLYRSYQGSGKPAVSLSRGVQLVNCDISSVMNISAIVLGGQNCTGRMFKHCEDPTKLRVQFNSCEAATSFIDDYRCMANFEGHYWETILLLQNIHTPEDVRCFVFSQLYPGEAYAMWAGQCDERAFEFARSGLRKPLLKLKFHQTDEKCLPVPPETVSSTASSLKVTSQPQRFVNSHDTMDDESRHSGSSGLIGTADTRQHLYTEPGNSDQKSITVGNNKKVEVPKRERNTAPRLSVAAFSTFALSSVSLILQLPFT